MCPGCEHHFVQALTSRPALFYSKCWFESRNLHVFDRPTACAPAILIVSAGKGSNSHAWMGQGLVCLLFSSEGARSIPLTHFQLVHHIVTVSPPNCDIKPPWSIVSGSKQRVDVRGWTKQMWTLYLRTTFYRLLQNFEILYFHNNV